MNNTLTEGGITYSFTKTFPELGYCESQKGLGPLGPIKELGNSIFCLFSAAPGLVGVLAASNRHMSFIYIYMYAMLFGHGIISAAAHMTLWNGFDKMGDAVIKILSPLLIAGFGSCIRMTWAYRGILCHLLNLTLIFTGVYAAVSIVISSSFYGSWVAWSTFDMLWGVIGLELLLIWFWLDRYKHQDPVIFRTVWYILIIILVAYTFWAVDLFGCCLPVAALYFHGWWHVCLNLAFYHCVVLQSFLVAHRFSVTPVVNAWPSRKFFVLVTVTWTEDTSSGESRPDTSPLISR